MTMDDLRHSIRTARISARLSQVELARKSGVSRSTIEGVENGRVLEIGLNKTLRILAVLDLTLKLDARRTRPTFEDLVADDD